MDRQAVEGVERRGDRSPSKQVTTVCTCSLPSTPSVYQNIPIASWADPIFDRPDTTWTLGDTTEMSKHKPTGELNALDVNPMRDRRMIAVKLMGGHSHQCRTGKSVHIWQRDGTFLARGSYEGRRFGETLGATEIEATARLRELLVKMDDGRYIRPCESKKLAIATARTVHLPLRELINSFLLEKRKLRGRKTTDTYKSRLLPVLEFVDQPTNLKRWPYAESIDRTFAIDLRAFLYTRNVTPNGRPGAEARPMSARTVINTLECLRTMSLWGQQVDVRKLPSTWSNPLTKELIGQPAPKDPFREDKLPPEVRIRLVQHMDIWQILHLSLSLVLPLRPNEAAGLLVSEVDFVNRWIKIGTRLGGADFTKARQSFRLPFPDELEPIFQRCVEGRPEGPLLRSRVAFERKTSKLSVGSCEDMERLFDKRLKNQPPGSVQNDQDRKGVFRKVLREMGGVTEDRLRYEFKNVLKKCDLNKISLYDLRHANTKGLKDAGVPELEMRYLTSHTTSDILNTYTPLDPVAAMKRYFEFIQPLLRAISQRASELGLVEKNNR